MANRKDAFSNYHAAHHLGQTHNARHPHAMPLPMMFGSEGGEREGSYTFTNTKACIVGFTEFCDLLRDVLPQTTTQEAGHYR
jgi:hypothetical protein